MTRGGICILGMHRSGTSVVSRMLNLVGVSLGTPSALAGAGDDNPRGYWEHLRIRLINDAILEHFGGHWDAPPTLSDGWPASAALAPLAADARAILDGDFPGSGLWGFKDPRTSLTLPFWQAVAGPLLCVICVRNPRAAVASLVRRSGIPPDVAERLWLTYVERSLAHTHGASRLLVFYEDVMTAPERELRRMAAFVGRESSADDPAVRAALDDFIEPRLCHHDGGVASLVGDDQITLASAALFLALRAMRDDEDAPGAVDPGALASMAARARDEGHLAAAYRGAARRESELLATIGRLEGTVQQVTADRDAHAREHAELRRTLGTIYASRAWAIITSGRRVMTGAFPPGTRRRRVLNDVIGRLAGRQRPVATPAATPGVRTRPT